MTTIISTRHYANYYEDEANATTETGNDTSEVNYSIPKMNSTTTTILGVHGNMNTEFSPRYDATYSKIDKANATRISGDETLKNQHPINKTRAMKRPALVGSRSISQ